MCLSRAHTKTFNLVHSLKSRTIPGEMIEMYHSDKLPKLNIIQYKQCLPCRCMNNVDE